MITNFRVSDIIFLGVTIRSADLRQDKTGAYCRLRVRAVLSQPVSDAMLWPPLPECVDQTKLVGQFTALNLALKPNAKELRPHEFRIERSEVSDFQLHRRKQGGATREELHFIVRVSEPGAIGIVEAYVRAVGKEDGSLRAELEHVELDSETGSAAVRRRRK